MQCVKTCCHCWKRQLQAEERRNLGQHAPQAVRRARLQGLCVAMTSSLPTGVAPHVAESLLCVIAITVNDFHGPESIVVRLRNQEIVFSYDTNG